MSKRLPHRSATRRETKVVTRQQRSIPFPESAGLTTTEEQVIRMCHAISLDEDSPLGLKTEDPVVLGQLAQIELLAWQQISNPPEESPRDRILARLRRRR